MLISEAINRNDAEDLAIALDSAGVDCGVTPDGNAVHVPGYGEIWYEPAECQSGPGWFVCFEGQTSAVEPDELADDLQDFVNVS